MPGRNLHRVDVEDGYYHIYSRGVNGRTIFKNEKDYTVFLNLFKRYLSKKPAKDKNGVDYPHYRKKLELLAYCLMPNHIHIFIYQAEQGFTQKFMQSLMTSYSMYFNKTYKRRGPLFESRYRASKIDNQAYLEHISRYIHLNPKDWKNYTYSSLPYFISGWKAEWIAPNKISEIFNSKKEYQEFLEDHEGYKAMLDDIKFDLAGN